MGNRDYWVGKKERAEQAKKHTAEMTNTFAEEIEACVKQSTIFRKNGNYWWLTSGDTSAISMTPHTEVKDTTPEFVVTTNDSVTELFHQDAEHGVVLNFASYKAPGGRFLDGSYAQEEALCHESYLYNILKEFPSYYEENNKHLNKGLYTDAAIYTPGVRFIRGEMSTIYSVLTCAAPNRSLEYKYGSFSDKENSAALASRVTLIKEILEYIHADIAILGAWGCGVFMQDPNEVAGLIKKEFEHSSIKKIVFPIPAGSRTSNPNIAAFLDTFRR